MAGVQVLFAIYGSNVSENPNPNSVAPFYCDMVTAAVQNAVNAAGGPAPSITADNDTLGGDPDFGIGKTFSAIYLNASGALNSLTVQENQVATFA